VRDLGTGARQSRSDARCAARAAADNDLIITSGGVSVGEEDHVKPAVEAEGRWICGKSPSSRASRWPLARCAVTLGGKAWFIGLPGNPVSAIVTFLIWCAPSCCACRASREVTPRAFNLRADFDWLRAPTCARVPACPDE
jgi:molybdopterin molybdotransferase